MAPTASTTLGSSCNQEVVQVGRDQEEIDHHHGERLQTVGAEEDDWAEIEHFEHFDVDPGDRVNN